MIRLQVLKLVFGRTELDGTGRRDGWTDRRGSRDSYLDSTSYEIHIEDLKSRIIFSAKSLSVPMSVCLSVMSCPVPKVTETENFTE